MSIDADMDRATFAILNGADAGRRKDNGPGRKAAETLVLCSCLTWPSSLKMRPLSRMVCFRPVLAVPFRRSASFCQNANPFPPLHGGRKWLDRRRLALSDRHVSDKSSLSGGDVKGDELPSTATTQPRGDRRLSNNSLKGKIGVWSHRRNFNKLHIM